MDFTEKQEQEFRARFEANMKEYATLKDAAYNTLKDEILQNCIQGEISEPQLVKILGISRTPIRDAMQQLANDGLLESSHGKKARIRSLTHKDIQDIAIILEELHYLSITLCIDNATEEDISNLEEIVALIQFYAGRGDLHRLHNINTRFHLQITRASKNVWLSDIMERLLSYTTAYRELALSQPNRMEKACQEHLELFEVIRDRNKELATQLIRQHVQTAFRTKELPT